MCPSFRVNENAGTNRAKPPLRSAASNFRLSVARSRVQVPERAESEERLELEMILVKVVGEAELLLSKIVPKHTSSKKAADLEKDGEEKQKQASKL